MRLPRLPRDRPRPPARRTGPARPGTARPAVQRRTRERPQANRAPDARRSRRTGLTSRAAVLAVALCAVLLTLAVPLQQYVAQRSQIRELAAQERQQRARVEELQRQQLQWKDPAYIRQQAKQRLHFVKPGETAYVIVDPAPKAASTPPPVPHETAKSRGPWFSQLWSTVEVAGAGSTVASPTP